jgi:hypothetical protein
MEGKPKDENLIVPRQIIDSKTGATITIYSLTKGNKNIQQKSRL